MCPPGEPLVFTFKFTTNCNHNQDAAKFARKYFQNLKPKMVELQFQTTGLEFAKGQAVMVSEEIWKVVIDSIGAMEVVREPEDSIVEVVPQVSSPWAAASSSFRRY